MTHVDSPFPIRLEKTAFRPYEAAVGHDVATDEGFAERIVLGDALKLVRSFLAASVVESLDAAEAVGYADWARDEILR